MAVEDRDGTRVHSDWEWRDTDGARLVPETGESSFVLYTHEPLGKWLEHHVYRDVDELGGVGWWYVCPDGLRRWAWWRWSARLRCLWVWRNEP